MALRKPARTAEHGLPWYKQQLTTARLQVKSERAKRQEAEETLKTERALRIKAEGAKTRAEDARCALELAAVAALREARALRDEAERLAAELGKQQEGGRRHESWTDCPSAQPRRRSRSRSRSRRRGHGGRRSRSRDRDRPRRAERGMDPPLRVAAPGLRRPASGWTPAVAVESGALDRLAEQLAAQLADFHISSVPPPAPLLQQPATPPVAPPPQPQHKQEFFIPAAPPRPSPPPRSFGSVQQSIARAARGDDDMDDVIICIP